MYDDLEKMVKKKQKERYIRLAKEAQENYESRINNLPSIPFVLSSFFSETYLNARISSIFLSSNSGKKNS